MLGQGLNCDEKGELADEESEGTFEEALEDEPNDENVRFHVFNFSDISLLGFNLLSFVGRR